MVDVVTLAAVVAGTAAVGSAISALSAFIRAWRKPPTVHVKLPSGKTISVDAASGQEEVQKQLKTISDEILKDLDARAARTKQ